MKSDDLFFVLINELIIFEESFKYDSNTTAMSSPVEPIQPKVNSSKLQSENISRRPVKTKTLLKILED